MNSIKKIVIIGPESTGKTTIAKQLAEHYQTTLVNEYAREYIEKLNRDYEEHDLLKIAKGQIQSEEKALQIAKTFLICDTDLRVIKIWSEVKYNKCDDWILQEIKERKYDLYCLCGIDIPWEEDAQREHPNQEDRMKLYKMYQQELQKNKQSVIELDGNPQKRLKTAIKALNSLL